MAIDISGVTLPNVPANVLVRYPSAVILEMTGSDGTVYVLLASVSAFGHASGTVLGSTDYSELVGSFGAGRAYYAQADASVWDVDGGEVAAGELMLPVGTVDSTTVTLVWANHDVQEVTTLDASTGEYTTDGVYFAQTADTSTVSGNNDANIYRIRRSRLAGIGDQVRRLTEVSPDLTPEEIEAMLAELDITLEEAYVTPTTEQQEIYPSVYGFSKVIVEAVEDSGSSGGGGTGEGGDNPGGDTGEELYPPSDDMLFGYNFETTPEETGYSIYNGKRYPTLPASLPYVILYSYYGEKFAASDVPWVTDSYGSYVAYEWHAFEEGTYDSTTETWTVTTQISDSGGNSSVSGSVTVIWSSQDLVKPNGTYIMAGTTAEVETEGDYSGDYTKNDGTYTIEGSTLNELGGLIQKITGTNEAMSPAEMIEALKVLAGEETTGEETTE